MSRFVDAAATREVALGPCQCPGTPHESDWVRIKGDPTAIELILFARERDGGEIAAAISPFVVEWNLLADDGTDWPPSEESISALRLNDLTAIVTALNEAMDLATVVPNESSAPSAASSRGSASRTRKPTQTPTT